MIGELDERQALTAEERAWMGPLSEWTSPSYKEKDQQRTEKDFRRRRMENLGLIGPSCIRVFRSLRRWAEWGRMVVVLCSGGQWGLKGMVADVRAIERD
uniref:Uncharacterized protein n=1 Tax=Cannabis sativa TaxID=3483 RepID=A0A803P551_CANSA